MSSDQLKIAKLKHREVQIAAMRDIVIAYEPLVTIVGAAAGLGFLENQRFGSDNYQLISTNQKRVLLAGIVAIEVARSGLIGQVGGAVSDVTGALTAGARDMTGVITPLLGVGG